MQRKHKVKLVFGTCHISGDVFRDAHLEVSFVFSKGNLSGQEQKFRPGGCGQFNPNTAGAVAPTSQILISK